MSKVREYLYLHDDIARFTAAMYDSPDECPPPRLVGKKGDRTVYIKLGDPKNPYAIPRWRFRKGNEEYAILSKYDPLEDMHLTGTWHAGGQISEKQDIYISSAAPISSDIGGVL